MIVNPYLNFDGTCAEAFRFYEETFGGTDLVLLPFSEAQGSPLAKEPWAGERMMHARLVVGEVSLLGCDTPEGQYVKPQGFNVSLAVDTPEEVDRIFAALAEGGEVVMPLAETFFARRFGMVHDRFGTPWILLCERAGQG